MVQARSLESLTRLERKWCKHRACGLCEARMDRNICLALSVWSGHACTVEEHDQRRGNALATYKPRAIARDGEGV